MKIDDSFSPGIAQIAMPSAKDSLLSIVGAGINKYADDKNKKELFDFNKQTIKDRVHDDKAIADFANSGKTLLQWKRDGGAFKTAAGVDAADKLLRGRAKDALFAKKAKARTKQKPAIATVTTKVDSLAAYNRSLTPSPQVPNTPTPKVRTVTLYKNGKPVTIKVRG